MRILLVEDDRHLAASLSEALTAQHYAVDVVRDGETAWHYLTSLPYDLTLLDVTLPLLDGFSLCQRMRSRGNHAPVLMLTARDTSSDKVKGLDAGADAYMVKPFNLSELLAQIRALLRRGKVTATSMLSWGELRLNPTTYDVQYGDRSIRLTPKEFAILELLLHNGRRVLSRPTIIEAVWSLEEPPGEETVKAHVKALRQKLRKGGAPSRLIETVHGRGYRLS
ncbi:MAG: response regulator transcription factor [Cyanobacteria bacterium J06638_22]